MYNLHHFADTMSLSALNIIKKNAFVNRLVILVDAVSIGTLLTTTTKIQLNKTKLQDLNCKWKFLIFFLLTRERLTQWNKQKIRLWVGFSIEGRLRFDKV